MPSFDIVSQVNSMEIENAVNAAKKELANRFDFKGSQAEIVLEKNEIKLSAEDQFKIKALVEIVLGKISKRNISMKNVEQCEPDVSPLGHARQVIKIKQGIATDVAKQVTGFIRDGKFKVTTQIQDQQIRVTGKKLTDKVYARHSGYPGGFRSETLGDLLARRPEEVIRRAVRGMLPRNRVGESMSRRLHVYAGPEHPHAAQQPERLEKGFKE